MRRVAASLLFLLLLAGHAWGYGAKGHQIIGFVADARLHSIHARQRISQLLQPGESLAGVSTWADDVKFHPVTEEQRQFVATFPQHAEFHYVDLWHRLPAYDPKATGARPDDLIQMLTTCIRVLQGKSSQFAPRIALLLLVHYVGDLQQPLHVGCGYIAQQGSQYAFVNPADHPGAEPDRGGNALHMSPLVPGGQTRLHGFWDVDAVDRATGDASAEDYARRLITQVRAQPGWDASGPPDTWPARWAADSLRQADKAYNGVTISGKRETADPTKPEWDVTLPSNYLDASADLVRTQLAKGGYRLARLLDALWP